MLLACVEVCELLIRGFSDRYPRANSADQDQTAKEFHCLQFILYFLKHFSEVKLL